MWQKDEGEARKKISGFSNFEECVVLCMQLDFWVFTCGWKAQVSKRGWIRQKGDLFPPFKWKKVQEAYLVAENFSFFVFFAIFLSSRKEWNTDFKSAVLWLEKIAHFCTHYINFSCVSACKTKSTHARKVYIAGAKMCSDLETFCGCKNVLFPPVIITDTSI